MSSVTFENINAPSDRKLQFTLTPTSYPYANTVRRAIMTLVPNVAFRSDPPGIVLANPDIKILHNDSVTQPNELLAHRLSLIPIHGAPADTWDPDRFVFRIKMENEGSEAIDIFASDITVLERRTASDTSEILVEVPNRTFFVPNPITRETCLITSLPAKRSAITPKLLVELKATVGNGREHARFIPTCQASYGYTLDTNTERRNQYFEKWLISHKNVDPDTLKDDEQRRTELDREFKSMEIQRIFKQNEKGEPNSFDFQIETLGTIPTRSILEQALVGIQKICEPFMGLDQGDLPETVRIEQCDSQLQGFDIIFTGHDHTLGNLLQTWLSDNLVDGDESLKPRIQTAGYYIRHPLKDEMTIRIGLLDPKDNQMTVRAAIAAAAKGCHAMFGDWKRTFTGEARPASASSLGAQPTAANLAAGTGVKRTLKLKRSAPAPVPVSTSK
jgi:DNA-directed RNA polymerase subunit L/DNA-directed RNA polymerase alpha subunit